MHALAASDLDLAASDSMSFGRPPSDLAWANYGSPGSDAVNDAIDAWDLR